jgi:hypothetical protein
MTFVTLINSESVISCELDEMESDRSVEHKHKQSAHTAASGKAPGANAAHTHTHTPARTRTHTHTHARTHLKKARLPLIEVFVRGHVRCKRLSQEVQCIPLGSIPSQSQKQTGNTLTVDKKQAAQDDCDAPRHGVYLRPRVFVDTNVRVNIAYTGEEESTQTSTALRSNRTHHQCW